MQDMLGILSPEEIEVVLHEQLIGRLGCHTDKETYVVPISYAYDGETIICHSLEGKKTQMMRAYPNICLQVEEMKDMANWKSVLVQGSYEELKEPSDQNEALQKLSHRYFPIISSVSCHLGKLWPFYPENFAEVGGIIFRIRILTRSGRCESETASPELPG
jgi:nitroimidazol reductase NimA-like FMN-containing flavoprotein (pyridoxamine 5'-phosphate oxidase superfamily)